MSFLQQTSSSLRESYLPTNLVFDPPQLNPTSSHFLFPTPFLVPSWCIWKRKRKQEKNKGRIKETLNLLYLSDCWSSARREWSYEICIKMEIISGFLFLFHQWSVFGVVRSKSFSVCVYMGKIKFILFVEFLYYGINCGKQYSKTGKVV